MKIYSLVALGVAAALLGSFIKRERPEIGTYVTMAAGLIILIASVPLLEEVVAFLSRVTTLSGIAGSLVRQAFKISIAAWLCAIASNLCRDAGEGALAESVELAGRIIVLVMTLPIFEALIDVVLDLAGTGL